MDTTSEEPIYIYEILIQGHLDQHRLRQFEALTITHLPPDLTLLAGPVVDQAALHGLLSRIRDLGVTLVSVQRQETQSSF
mgnify:CR=1 FL=1